MTGADWPPPIPRQLDAGRELEAEPRLELPASLGSWVAALTLWPLIDEHSYRLVAESFAGGRVPGWTFFTSLVVHAGLVENGPTPDTYVLREDWRPELERELEVLGGADATRLKLVDAWTASLDPYLVSEIAQ